MRTSTANTMGALGYHNTYPDDPDGLERTRHLAARSLEVFGNSTSAGVWYSRVADIDGRRERPWMLAYESDAGLGAALTELDRIAPDITPDYHDPVAAAMKHRGSRRRRR